MSYLPAAGAGTANGSARIAWICDSRNQYQCSVGTYQFTYNGDAPQHLAGLTSYVGTAESYTLGYGGIGALSSPWGGSYGAASKLVTLTTAGLGVSHGFTYNGYGEMTGMTTPLGGSLEWTYGDGATSAVYREVTQRTGVGNTWTWTRDGATPHGWATVADAGAGSSKWWTFGGTGLAASYEEQGPGGVRLLRKEYTWTADGNGNVYVGSVVSKVKPGAGDEQSMKSAQTVDGNGNVTQSQGYEWGNLATPAKTYNFTYLGGSNYASRHILNRVTQVTVTPAGGSAVTVATNVYDDWTQAGLCNLGGLGSRPGLLLHDDANYGTGMNYRGNVVVATRVGSYACTAYETTGVAKKMADGAGHTVSTAPASSTGYALPGVITPGSESNLATTVNYANSWAVTSVTGPNGASGETTYDSYGRPQKVKIPDGAETNYTYTYVPNTQTATMGSGAGARWKKTTLDGFGRVTRVETGHDSTTVSQVDTEYAVCACSALGKLWRVSQPYAPGGTPVWTTYAYDDGE